ncbi:MAG: hypothetical protein KF901_21360 [Myxococcales bacterium]|nr:hypothetical protein [Myxococcales bacterium]
MEGDDDQRPRRYPRGAPTLKGLPTPVSPSTAPSTDAAPTEAESTDAASTDAAPTDATPSTGEPRRVSEPAIPLAPTREGRVTIDFSGPPLELPEDVDDVEGPAQPLALELDELREGDAASARPEPAEPLSLELDELDDEGAEALALVDKNPGSQPALDLAAEMAERYALDDFTGSLRVAELLLGRATPHPDAERIARESRRRLEQIYTSALGGTERVVEIAMPENKLRWLGLDHRAGFLLSRVDGVQTVEELLDVSGMLRLEALKTLVELLELGAIRTR